jgi:hypothetical protein
VLSLGADGHRSTGRHTRSGRRSHYAVRHSWRARRRLPVESRAPRSADSAVPAISGAQKRRGSVAHLPTLPARTLKAGMDFRQFSCRQRRWPSSGPPVGSDETCSVSCAPGVDSGRTTHVFVPLPRTALYSTQGTQPYTPLDAASLMSTSTPRSRHFGSSTTT